MTLRAITHCLLKNTNHICGNRPIWTSGSWCSRHRIVLTRALWNSLVCPSTLTRPSSCVARLSARKTGSSLSSAAPIVPRSTST
jgi:hypothetical protein